MKEKIFNILSIIFLLSFTIYFGLRFYNAYSNSKKELDNTYMANKLINTISKYTINNSLKKVDEEYLFIGNVNNNYIKYQGYTWRIIKIDNDNNITAILEDTITYLPYNSILTWINDNNGIKELDINYDFLDNTTLCIDSYQDINNVSCNNKNNDYKIGILNIKDYLAIGGNNSFLNNGTEYWVSDKYDDDNSWYINNDGKISNSLNTNKHGIRPIITIKNNSKYLSGNGSIDNPYIIEQRNIKELKDTLQGEYISFNNEIWKIMYNKDNKIKIINTDYMKYNNGNYVKYNFDDKKNTLKTSKIINFINTVYLNNLNKTYSNYLTNGEFNAGIYIKDNNNYIDSYKNKINLYVGLPSINEPFIYEIDNVYLMNTSNVDDLTTYSIYNNNLYEDLITSVRYIRPVIYLKDNISVTKGNGTKNNPYVLGGINEA